MLRPRRRRTQDIRDRYAQADSIVALAPDAIINLAGYFEAISSQLGTERTFWYRGHDDQSYAIVPSALRYRTLKHRDLAIKLPAQFRRLTELKFKNRPQPDDELGWLQLAQHYGLPTRLLDWTESATTALYFACLRSDVDGLVIVLNPNDLNRSSDPLNPRILDAHRDAPTIYPYLRLDGRRKTRGNRLWPVALHPVLNDERILLQRGVFTLHGNATFALDKSYLPSLVGFAVPKEHKTTIRDQLETIGVDEMSLFPEPEHTCNYLRRRAGLNRP